MQQSSLLNKNWFIVLASICAVILTIPDLLNYPGLGVDKAYIWAYNDLFINDFYQLRNLIFTYGPLGFLKFPLPMGYNWEIGFAFLFIIRFIQVLLFLFTIKNYRQSLHIGIYILALVLLKISSFDLIFASIMLCCSLLYTHNKRVTIFLLGLLLSSIALYIKFSMGMLSFSIFFGYIGWGFISRKITFKHTLLLISLAVSFVWILGYVLSSKIGFAFDYIANAFQISSAYAASLSLHPESNIKYLLASLTILVLGYMIIQYKQWKPLVFIPLVCGLFITWKHSIVREEAWHIFLLVQFIIMMWLFLIVISEKRKFWLTILAFASIGCLWIYTRDLGGVKQFLIKSNHHTSFVKQCQALVSHTSEVENDPELQTLVLPKSIRNYIGDKTVDVYPWELNYVQANKLNWIPRPALQAIDFNAWLDKKNLSFYKSKDAPDFIIWHKTEDNFGRELGGLESRYLLSSEPYTIDVILSYYEQVFRSDDAIILQRIQSPEKPTFHREIASKNLSFGEMVEVPKLKGLLKADVKFSLNKKGKFLSALYKEPAIFIRYKWNDGTEYYYNVQRHNSRSGIWIQPFISSFYLTNSRLKEVDSIGFYNTDPSWMNDEISLTWLYNITPTTVEKISSDIDTVVYRKSALENKTEEVPPYLFVNLFEVPVDSLPQFDVEIDISAQSKHQKNAKSRLVISIDNDGKSSYWSASYNDGYLPCRERWGTVHLHRNIDLRKYKGHILKIYFWNEGAFPYEVSSANMMIRMPRDLARREWRN